MPRNVPISLGSMSYRSSLPWSAQRLVNWYPENAPPEAATRTPYILKPRPGANSLQTILGKSRCHYVLNDTLYAVFGNKLYSIDTDYQATELGTVSSSGTVYMCDNGNSQVCVTIDPLSWIYDSDSATLSQISDVDFPGASSVTSLDGYFIFSQTGNGGEFFLSDQEDGTTFDALDFASAEMQSDKLIRAFADHGELWLFGSKTTEIWTPVTSSSFPFARSTNAGPERGVMAGDSVCKLDNTIFALGDDGIVYRYNGYTPTPVSTRPIEEIIATSSAPSSIYGRAYTQNGHPFYVLTSEGDWTVVYDPSTQMWHERATFGEDYWKLVNPIAFNGIVVAGGIEGDLYELDVDTFDDDGESIRYEVTSPPLHANGAKLSISYLEALMETGVGLSTGQGSDPQAMLQWSDDGGRTWSNEHWRTMGAIGEYNTRCIWRGMGQTYSRVYKLAVTDPVRPYLLGAYANYDITP